MMKITDIQEVASIDEVGAGSAEGFASYNDVELPYSAAIEEFIKGKMEEGFVAFLGFFDFNYYGRDRYTIYATKNDFVTDSGGSVDMTDVVKYFIQVNDETDGSIYSATETVYESYNDLNMLSNGVFYAQQGYVAPGWEEMAPQGPAGESGVLYSDKSTGDVYIFDETTGELVDIGNNLEINGDNVSLVSEFK
ncbi:hypothetical protein FZC84_21305 [Rossellomorea vietnamensis]|uniref:Uncharacterized protein n=1 Tax=Rossellomorea vietnamensis TaxID=218284 RepID=A0A5D4M2C9_9BACI|nr:hypothetical protein [Rossellomorea vietnamensis]TYR95732.1 hypothetical protein FZC84_21305 [Rossellomorea vietnamensis]